MEILPNYEIESFKRILLILYLHDPTLTAYM